MPVTSPAEVRRRTDWALFADWCAATGHEALPADLTTVEAFLRAVSGSPATQQRRWRSIRQTHHRRGLPMFPPGSDYVETQRPWRTGDGWLPLPAALAVCPVMGWPAGFRGRRDGWLLVLAGALGLTRRQMLAVTADRVVLHPGCPQPVEVDGQAVPVEEDARCCPACAVVRWLHVVGLADVRSRWAVKEVLQQPWTATHACQEPIPGYWRDVWMLTPAIDRWGWMTDWRVLHPRTLSAVLAARQAPGQAPPPALSAPTPEAAEKEPVTDRSGWSDDEVFELLEERTRAADEVMARIAAFLDANPMPAPVAE